MSKPELFQSLKRTYRNSLRKKNRILPGDLPEPFFHGKDINAVGEHFAGLATHHETKLTDLSGGINGRCFLCNQDVLFEVDIPADGSCVNWRETLVCQQCKLINRWRGCLHAFEAICEPTVDDRIYLTESLSPIYENLVGRFPLLISSEYFPDRQFGEMVQTHIRPVRNEDVTKLSFADSSLDVVLSFDVLEHVPDYRSALREFYRVLDNGGQLVISVPFSNMHETLVRATVDEEGNINHLVEPCYHGDPLSEQGVLSYYDFGMVLLDEMRDAGFDECFLLCYNSRKWAYLNDNVVFVARKLNADQGASRLVNLSWQRACYWPRFMREGLAELLRFSARALESFSVRVLRRLFIKQPPLKTAPAATRSENPGVLELPEIFHYWSNKYLLPEMSRFGFTDPTGFFFLNTLTILQESKGWRTNILSIGAGECEFELQVAKWLLQSQLSDFVIDCLDVNPDKLSAARKAVKSAGMEDHFRFIHADMKIWKPFRKYGVVYANQALHDVQNLERLFDSVKRSLKPGGVFIIFDKIGRNDNLQWPETVKALEPFWDKLPETYRFNRLLDRQETQFMNRVDSDRGFGPSRSQDILPLLVERFKFKVFFPYGNLIFVFIDRSFGHNFDISAEWDRDFVDRIHVRDESGMVSGELKPASMLAVLTNRDTTMVLRHPELTPEKCVRKVFDNNGPGSGE